MSISIDNKFATMAKKTSSKISGISAASECHGFPKIRENSVLDKGRSSRKRTISLQVKRTHEKFLPQNLEKIVTVEVSHLSIVYETWSAFISGDSSSGTHSPRNSEKLSYCPTPVTLLYDSFYERLFMLSPSMRDLFGANMVRQSRCLIRFTCECAGLLEAIENGKGLAGVTSIVYSNAEFGIRAEHYETMSMALRYAISTCFGDTVSNFHVAEAWNNVIEFVVAACISTTVCILESTEPRQSESEQMEIFQAYRTAAIDHMKNSNMPTSSPRTLSGQELSLTAFGIDEEEEQPSFHSFTRNRGKSRTEWRPRIQLSDVHEGRPATFNLPRESIRTGISLSLALPYGNHHIECPSPGNRNSSQRKFRRMLSKILPLGSSTASVATNTSVQINYAMMTAGDALSLIEKSSPEELCFNAVDIAGVLLRWLSPMCTPKDKGIALHAAVGWVWKLLAINRVDLEVIKLQRSALRSHLPRIVPAVLLCAEGSLAYVGVGGLRSSRALQIEALDALAQIARFLQVRFIAYVDMVRRSISPLLANGGSVVRATAASALSALALCSTDEKAWEKASLYLCIEANVLLEKAWPDSTVDMHDVKLDSPEIIALMSKYALLPPFSKEDKKSIERYSHSLARRFPALITVLCRLLVAGGKLFISRTQACMKHQTNSAELIGAVNEGRVVQSALVSELAAKNAAIEVLEQQNAIHTHHLLILAILERILRIGKSADLLCGPTHEDIADAAIKGLIPPAMSPRAIMRVTSEGLTPAAALTILPKLQHGAVVLLKALVTTAGLPVPQKLQSRTCACIAQYVVAMPVKTGLRETVYQAISALAENLDDSVASSLISSCVTPLIDEMAMLLGHSIPVHSHFRRTSFDKKSNFTSSQFNRGHGNSIDIATSIAAAQALTSCVTHHSKLLPIEKRRSIEILLLEGMELLALSGGRIKPADKKLTGSLNFEIERRRQLSGPVFKDETEDDNDSRTTVSITGNRDSAVKFPATRVAIIRLAAEFIVAYSINEDSSIYGSTKTVISVCSRDSEPSVVSACQDAVHTILGDESTEQWGLLTPHRRLSSTSKAAAILGLGKRPSFFSHQKKSVGSDSSLSTLGY